MTSDRNAPTPSWFKSSYSQSEAACVEVAHLPNTFHKSTHSGASGTCVEVAHFTGEFRKSSHSGPNGCVEVADLGAGAAVRDSKNPHLDHVAFVAPEWSAFLQALKTGELDH